MSAVIRGSKGGAATHTPVESADNLRSISFFRILDLVSEGEIGGLVNGQQSIFLDETPLGNSDGSSNFPKAHIEQRTGTQDQDAIPGFDSVENEISVGVELKSSAAWLHSVSDVTLSALRVTLGVPSLSKANTSNGDITGYTIAYKIEVSTDGGAFAVAYNGAFTGKTTTKFQRSHRIDLPTATTGWQVRVTRLTANAGSSAIADTTTVDSYTEIVDAKLRYPNSALIGVMGDASQFSNIPQRAYDVWGRIVKIPSNYDVTTRAYAGVWDGTFVPSWTDNPAWVFYDLVTHPRYGLGHLITAAQVDKWELYKIGQYCDGMVSDGNGGSEPRLTCNIYLQTQADAYKLLNDLSTAFRGISYWANGAIMASADMPADPVYTYTDANVIEGKFSYSASARKTRFTTALVSWNDPRNFYRTKVEYVEDRDGIARYGIQQTEVTAVGCASQGQAQRLGRWILLTSRFETDTVTFSVGLDGTLAAPGQIIRIADSARAGKRQGGRVVSATTTGIVTDKAPTVAVGDSLTVIMADGVSQTRTVSAVSGAAITVSTAFTAAPAAQSMWVVESTALAAQTFRVLAVTEDKSDTAISFTLTCLQHNDSKFSAVDTGTIIQVPPISALKVTNQPGPTAVSLTSTQVVGAVGTYSLMSIAWTAVPGAISYEGAWRKDNGEWQPIGGVSGLSADVVGTGAGDYTARIRAKGTGNAYSLYTLSNPFAIADNSALPTDVAAIGAGAAAAQADADAANAALADIASDGILSPNEKPVVIRDNNVILAEQAGIDAQAVAYGITTQKTAYDTAVGALTAYLATLTTPVLWSNLTGNTTIVGATFRSKFADVYTTRQALLNAIYAAAKAKADAAQATADAATTSAVVQNSNFTVNLAGWTFQAAPGPVATGEFFQEQATNSPYAPIPTYLMHLGQVGQTACYADSSSNIPVQPGQQVIGVVALRSVFANSTARAQAYLKFYDANGSYIGFLSGTPLLNPSSGPSQLNSTAKGPAPAGAAFVRMSILYTNHTTNHISATCARITVSLTNQDDLPNGATYTRGVQNSGSGTAIDIPNGTFQLPADLNGNIPGWFIKSGVANISTATAYYGVQSIVAGAPDPATALSVECLTQYKVVPGDHVQISGMIYAVSGKRSFVSANFYKADGTYISDIEAATSTGAWLPVSNAGFVPANAVTMKLQLNIDKPASGNAYAYFNSINVQINDLRAAGSGARIGDQRNLTAVTFGNYGSGWSGLALSYTATSTSATISASAATLQAGGAATSYSASSVTIGGSPGGVYTFYLYYSDAGLSGGAKTLQATTNQIASLSNDGYVLLGTCKVTYPTSGTGGGGGGPSCPVREAWVYARRGWIIAGDVTTDDELWLPRELRWGRVTYSQAKLVECVRIDTANDAPLSCSLTAPIGTYNADVLAPDLLGLVLPSTIDAARNDDTCTAVTPLGLRWVQHITCEHSHFLAGDTKGRALDHHNLKPG